MLQYDDKDVNATQIAYDIYENFSDQGREAMVQKFKEVLQDPVIWENVKNDLLDAAIRNYLTLQENATRRRTVTGEWKYPEGSKSARDIKPDQVTEEAQQRIAQAIEQGHSQEEFGKAVDRLKRSRVDFPVPFFHKRIQDCTGAELMHAASRARKTADTYIDTAEKLELVYKQLEDEDATVGEQLSDTQLHMILHEPREAA